ncbi:unnamed protein product [Caenorhabditis auriculariae]|uniref:Bestrophin homolog n=1 Tax=Caenorhabditis auriculariae TaxID=2777116 RepID=A0A8S1H986_9PELO|nr:unnamed protein product [Caenorhabditis auriculariae]
MGGATCWKYLPKLLSLHICLCVSGSVVNVWPSVLRKHCEKAGEKRFRLTLPPNHTGVITCRRRQMTVSYNLDVSSTSIIAFLKLQLRWRGSIWKSVMKELVIFTTLFAFVTTVYRTNYFLSEEQRKFWDNFSALFDQKLDYIPLTFMLGFFVTIIVGRWNDIFNNIGWVDNTALLLATYIRGSDEKSRLLRRNILRYMVLTQVMIFRDISMQVRRRFPTLETVVAAGFMLEAEREKYEELQLKYNKYFLPIQWCFTLLYEARTQGKIGADVMLNELIKSVSDFRRGLGQLCNFDWVPIPLVYPQVVFLAVRSYFFLCLIARQSVLIDGEPPKDNNPVYPLVPFLMTALQFIFYVGWMKVAESLMNPLGEDDDDFECNFLLDRNLAVGLTIVDDCYNEAPAQQKDIFWSVDVVEPLYSSGTALKPQNPRIGSATNYEVTENEVVMMPHVDNEAYEEGMLEDVEGTRLLPRGVSVVSVNRQSESRTSLASRNKGFFTSIKNHISGTPRKVSRPNRLNSSMFSISTNAGENNFGESSLSILDDLAEEAKQSQMNQVLTPEEMSSPRRTPIDVPLTSVPEEDEEVQRTKSSADLKKWKQALDRELQGDAEKDKQSD